MYLLRKKQIVVYSTIDLDENIVYTTLQQPRVSGDMKALFQIKIKVKNKKVKALLDNGFQFPNP